MTAVERYNALQGRTVTREELEEIAILGDVQGQLMIGQKIRKILAAFEDPEFRIEISQTAIDQVPEDSMPGLEYADTEEEFTGLEKAVSPDEIYQYITDLMLNTIKEVGHLPWQKEWKESSLSNGSEAMNWKTKKKYRGINYFLLNFKEAIVDGKLVMVPRKFENPYFLTFNQIKESGGKLREGSKGTRIVYFTKLYKYEQAEPELSFGTYSFSKMVAWLKKNRSKISLMNSFAPESIAAQNAIPILKYYNVFSAEDVEGVEWEIQAPVKRTEAEKIDSADAIVWSMPKAPKISHGGGRAYYMPSADYIQMPNKEDFNKVHNYYTTLFHELVHSTGHHKRLDRDMRGGKGSKSYAFEELIAEMGAVYLCAESGILFETRDNSAKYLRGWNSRLIKNMEEDNRFFFRAASQAQAASDFILDRDKEGVPAYQNSLKSESKEDKIDLQDPKTKNDIKKRKEAAFKKGDKAYYTDKKQNVTIRKVSIPKKGSALEHENRVYDIVYSNERKAIGIPESKLEKARKDPKPVKKEQKDTNQLLEEQKKAKPQAKTKTEFEKGLKKIGLEVISYSGKQKSPQEWKREYKLNYKDIAGVTLEMELKRVKKTSKRDEPALAGTVKFEGIGLTFEDYIFYNNPSEFYGGILEEIQALFDMSLKEEAEIKKEFSNTLFHGKEPSGQLGLFGGKEISTEAFRNMKVSELRKFTLDYYRKFLAGKKVAITNSLKNVSFINKAGRKIAHGGPMYAAKAALVNNLEEIIKSSTYNNWGDRKAGDHKDVLGYLNFKSKVTIDGEKKHVRIAVEVWKNRETLLKNYDTGRKEEDDLFPKGSKRLPSDGGNKSSSDDKDNKKNNPGLNGPVEVEPTAPQPRIQPEPAPVAPKPQSQPNQAKSLAEAMQQQTPGEIFNVPGDIGRFLGQVERKPVHSVVTTLDAEQGAGKTRFLFQVMNVLAGMGLRCLFISLEEHPASKLFRDKVKQYIDSSNLERISALEEVENWNRVKYDIHQADVIFIDSFQKLPPNLDLDQDIRKAFDGKWFFVIYQQTGTKSMRGGSKAAFDGDQVLKVSKDPEDYRNNFVYANKNRYNDAPDLKLNIFSGKLEGDYPKPEPELSGSRDPIPKPTGRLIATPVV